MHFKLSVKSFISDQRYPLLVVLFIFTLRAIVSNIQDFGSLAANHTHHSTFTECKKDDTCDMVGYKMKVTSHIEANQILANFTFFSISRSMSSQIVREQDGCAVETIDSAINMRLYFPYFYVSVLRSIFEYNTALI